MAGTQSMSLEAIARYTLDLPEDSQESIPQHYLDEVSAIVEQNPRDTLFKVTRQPGTGFGIAICQEAKCGKKQFDLIAHKNDPDGGKTFGVGSLEDLLHHQKESPKHFKARKERLLAENVEEDISLAPKAFRQSTKKTGSSSASASKAVTAPASGNNSFRTAGNETFDLTADTSNSSSGSSKRKSDVITIDDDSDNDDIMVISSKPAVKKPRVPESKGDSSVKPTFFPSSSNVDRKPLVKTTSNGSNVSRNSSFTGMREDKKPVIVTSSPVQQQAIKPISNNFGFSSSPSRRERGEEEDKMWREMRKLEDTGRQLRNTVRFNPDDMTAGEALLRNEQERELLEEQMNRVKEGKKREPSTEDDDDLPDVRMAASKDGPKPDLSAYLRVGGEAGPSSRPAAASANPFIKGEDVKPASAPRINNGLPPMMPGGFNFADNYPAGPQALALAQARNRACLPQPKVKAPHEDDSDDDMKKARRPAPLSDSEDEVDPLGLGAAINGMGLPETVGFAGPTMFTGDPRAVDSRLANFFSDAVSGHDFDEEGERAIEKALDVLKLKDLKSKIPNTSINLFPHQVLGVAWMLNQEKSKYKSGILADEMGLGKTVQAISTIVLNPAAPDDKKCKTTLILAPLALLEQWKDEIELKTEGRLSCLIYHGTNKPTSTNEIRKYDIVLTTTGTLLTQWVACDDAAKAKAKKAYRQKHNEEWGSDDEADWYDNVVQTGILFRITWRRVIIDEAQVVRTRTTKGSRAICSLNTGLRWCLSGTPMVNELSDYYSYLRWMQIKPWHHWSEWNNHIKKLEKRRPTDAANRAQAILKSVLLRRNKESTLNGVKLITLPTKHKEDFLITLSPDEREIYDFVEARAQEKFSRYLKEGTVMKNYASVLVMLLRLRMLCGHPALIQQDTMKAALEDPDEEARLEMEKATKAMGKDWVARMQKKRLDAAVERSTSGKNGEEVDIEECQICYEALTTDSSMITNCSHIFCKTCLDAVMDDEARQAVAENANPGDRSCPSCRTPIKKATNFKLGIFEPSKEELAYVTGEMQEDDDFEDEIADYLEKKTGHSGKSAQKTNKKKTIKIDSEDEDELASSPGPKARRAKSKAAKKRIIADSEDEAGGGNDTEDDDFIDDDEVHEKNRVKGYTKRTGARSDSEYESGSEAIEDESEDEEPKKKRFSSEEKGKSRAKAPSKSALNMFTSKTLIPSTKIDATVKIMEQAPVEDKFMLLSQWTSMLDLVAIALDQKGIPYVRFQGSYSRGDRDRAVKQFNTNPKKKVLLMSLKAGGVGLNLVGGNRVINLDLAWSPAVENQAFDRVHRLGQRKEVYITRVIVANSVDERLQAIQQRKQLLADSSLGEGTGKKLGKIGVNELKALFGLA